MPPASDFRPIPGDSLPDLSDGFRLGGWDVDPRRNRASRGGNVQTIEPKVMQVLMVLARHAGEPVTRDLLMATVWPDVIVTDDTLTRCVSEARKIFDRAMDDSPANGGRKSVIETIPKVGYSLVAPIRPRHGARRPRSGTPEAIVVRPENPVSERAADGPVLTSDEGRPRMMYLLGAALFLVVAAGAVFAAVRLTAGAANETSPMPGSVQPATSMAGTETMPAWSPNGRNLAFVHTPDGPDKSRLMAGEPADPRPRILFEARRGAIRSPVWSPDGLSILFVHMAPDGCTVMTVPALGGPAESVAECSSPFTSIDVSSDGALLAMDDWSTAVGHTRITVVNLSSGEHTHLTVDSTGYSDYAPQFSPDGRSVLFARSIGEGQMDLFIYDLTSRSVRRLTSEKAGIAGHRWSTSGTRVLFSTWQPGGPSLRVLDLQSGDVHTLGLNGMYPDVSGSRAVFERRLIDSDILVRDDQGVRKVCDSTRSDRFPVLAPDGRTVVFASDRAGQPALYSCDLLSGELSPVETGSFDAVLAPHIAPDGRIAFMAVAHGAADIYVIDGRGEAPRRLTSESSNDVYPFFSPDGKRVYFGSDRSGRMQIWRMPIGGGPAEQITQEGGMTGRLSPDGGVLFFQKEGEAGLWRVAASGGSAELLDADIDLSSMFSWLPTESGILIADRSADGMIELELLDPETGERHPVGPLAEARPAYGFAATSDRSVIALSVIDRVDSDLMITRLSGRGFGLESE